TETSVPRPTRILSGAFVFTLGRWNDEVRQDPEHLYNGEELALSIRSFTAGYDLYAPSRLVVWHRQHPKTNAKYIHDAAQHEVQRHYTRTMRRLRTLFSGDPEQILAPYSLGRVRSVHRYSEWSGLDCATMTASDDARTGVTPALLS
ncbi:MAG: GlcNAc-transferase family protein, partial [Acidimicrobiales bacterium]